MFKKILSIGLSFVFALSLFAVPAHAATSQASTLTPGIVLSNEEKAILNDWVYLDEDTKSFGIITGAQEALDNELYSKLVESIQISNANIALADFSTGEAIIVSPQDDTTIGQSGAPIRAAYKEGVTKVEFYFWGVRVFLSKTTVLTIGSGVAIAGIWIPEPVVSKIVATLGVVVALCPGGIVFDYNVWLGAAGAVNPGATIVFGSAINNIHFQ